MQKYQLSGILRLLLVPVIHITQLCVVQSVIALLFAIPINNAAIENVGCHLVSINREPGYFNIINKLTFVF